MKALLIFLAFLLVFASFLFVIVCFVAPTTVIIGYACALVFGYIVFFRGISERKRKSQEFNIF